MTNAITWSPSGSVRDHVAGDLGGRECRSRPAAAGRDPSAALRPPIDAVAATLIRTSPAPGFGRPPAARVNTGPPGSLDGDGRHVLSERRHGSCLSSGCKWKASGALAPGAGVTTASTVKVHFMQRRRVCVLIPTICRRNCIVHGTGFVCVGELFTDWFAQGRDRALGKGEIARKRASQKPAADAFFKK